jgi:hypothetical protein
MMQLFLEDLRGAAVVHHHVPCLLGDHAAGTQTHSQQHIADNGNLWVGFNLHPLYSPAESVAMPW